MGGEAGAREQKQQLFHNRSKERNLTENSWGFNKSFFKKAFCTKPFCYNIFFLYKALTLGEVNIFVSSIPFSSAIQKIKAKIIHQIFSEKYQKEPHLYLIHKPTIFPEIKVFFLHHEDVLSQKWGEGS